MLSSHFLNKKCCTKEHEAYKPITPLKGMHIQINNQYLTA